MPRQTQVKYPFALPKFRHRGRIAAAQAGGDCGHRQLVTLTAAVERAAECLVDLEHRWAAA